MNKVIHYCWFGGGPLTEQARRSIDSWGKYAPDFEVRRWDESNFDVSAYPWTEAAHGAEKWAFVSDYARFKVLYEYGGVYMDVGSQLIRDISPLVRCSPFSAIEGGTRTATTGLVASCEAADPVVAEVLTAYDTADFSNDPGFLESHTVNEMFTVVLERYGYMREDRIQKVAGWTLLPSEYFDPVYGWCGYHIKKSTYSIHHNSGSWTSPELRLKKRVVRYIAPFVGKRSAEVIGRAIGEIKFNGFCKGTLNLVEVTKSVVRKKTGRWSDAR